MNTDAHEGPSPICLALQTRRELSKEAFSSQVTPFHWMFGIQTNEKIESSENQLSDEGRRVASPPSDKYQPDCKFIGNQESSLIVSRPQQNFDRIRVKVKGKSKSKTFLKNLRVIQTLSFHTGAIWAIEFSQSGKYMCSAGADGIVAVWLVDSAIEPSTPNFYFSELAGSGVPSVGLIDSSPFREFTGHSGDVVDVSWSASDFLLSASIDKTVRLWHVSKQECLQVFRHPDIVTGVDFHPSIDKKFVTSCFDKRVRIWEVIPDPIIRQYCALREIITAVSFSPDGGLVACGLINGEVDTCDANNSGLRILSRMACKNKDGAYRQGRKVTGVQYAIRSTDAGQGFRRHVHSNSDPSTRRRKDGALGGGSSGGGGGGQDLELLVSTNDHRIRRMKMGDRSLQCKYKGLLNSRKQIKARFSEDFRWVISGSDNGRVLLWSTEKEPSAQCFCLNSARSQHRNSIVESFCATAADVVSCDVAVFVPVESLLHAASTSSALQQLDDVAELLALMRSASDSRDDHKVGPPATKASAGAIAENSNSKKEIQHELNLPADNLPQDPLSESTGLPVSDLIPVSASTRSASVSVTDEYEQAERASLIENKDKGQGEDSKEAASQAITADQRRTYDCMCRCIVTADSDGNIRVFARDLE